MVLELPWVLVEVPLGMEAAWVALELLRSPLLLPMEPPLVLLEEAPP